MNEEKFWKKLGSILMIMMNFNEEAGNLNFLSSCHDCSRTRQTRWIIDSGRSDELFVKECTTSSISRRNCFTYKPRFGIMITVILYRFFGANRRVEANGCHYLITNFGNC